MNPEIDANDSIDERPDLNPVGIPSQEGMPSVEDRIALIEDVLHLNA